MLEIFSNLGWVPWARSRLAGSIPPFRAVAVACTLEYILVLAPRLGQGPVKESPMVVDHKRGPDWAHLTH